METMLPPESLIDAMHVTYVATWRVYKGRVGNKYSVYVSCKTSGLFSARLESYESW